MDIFERMMDWLDNTVVQSSRGLAKRSSRRRFIGRLGALLVGASGLPLLPVSRANAEAPTELGDPQSCDYWRYCALRRFAHNLSTGCRALAHFVDRHVPQPGGRQRLLDLVQRLLRQSDLWALLLSSVGT